MTAVLLAAALWLAEPGSGPEADATAAKVRSLIDQAASQYDQGQFDDALQTLHRAYVLSPRAAILYNIAQVHRQRGDCNAALSAYQGYIAQSDATDPKHERALRWVPEMQACIERAKVPGAAPAEDPAAAAPAAAPAQPAVKSQGDADLLTLPKPGPAATLTPPLSVSVAPAEPPPPPSHRRALRWAGWGLVAAGALLEVGAAALEWKALSIESDVSSGAHSGPEIDRLERTGSRDERWAIWSAIAGGVLAGSGATMLVITRNPGPAAPRVALVSWAGAF